MNSVIDLHSVVPIYDDFLSLFSLPSLNEYDNELNQKNSQKQLEFNRFARKIISTKLTICRIE